MEFSADPRSTLSWTDVDEAELLARLRTGDERAYAELIERFGPRLLAVTKRVLTQQDDAEDALQETFVSVFKSLATFHGEARLGTWLHRIAVNAALMKRRAARRRGEHDGEPPSEFVSEPESPKFTEFGHWERSPRAWGESAAAPTLRAEQRELVRANIDRLPENLRIALVLRDIEEFDNAEVATRLGLSVNAAKIRVHRARQALRELLDPYFSSEDA